MIVIDEALLAAIRRLPCCYCGKPGPSEAAHLFAKGMGGAHRLDVAINVGPLCTGCHRASHYAGIPSFGDLLARICAREGLTQDEALNALYVLRRRTGTVVVPQRPARRRRADDHHRRQGEGVPGRGAEPAPGDRRAGLPTDTGWCPF